MDMKTIAKDAVRGKRVFSLMDNISTCEDLILYHDQIETMFAILLLCSIEDHSPYKIHTYISIIDDLARQGKQCSENLRISLSKLMTEEASRLKADKLTEEPADT